MNFINTKIKWEFTKEMPQQNRVQEGGLYISSISLPSLQAAVTYMMMFFPKAH